MHTLFTIGYEGTDIDRFIETLIIVGIETVADVRAVPVSRKKGFSKNKLCIALAERGIAYRHFPELGDPKPGREAARSGRMCEFESIYRAHLGTAGAIEGLRALRSLASCTATCLLCFERDPRNCHRSMIAHELRSCNISSFDLFGDEPNRYVRHAHALPSGRARESDSAPQPQIR
ncbi:DUF488 domain-containing protein [Salinarimonas chemoclinalis]|uniref:DUF488 domain-containing protein n=1 Tax=Salinarimonas chemoclinalis TaxID=3241599 RepID=UPI0035567E93